MLGTHRPFLHYDFFLLELEMSILYQSYHCILESHNLSGFTSSQVKKKFASISVIPGVSPISDLDDTEVRLWTLHLGLMLEKVKI